MLGKRVLECENGRKEVIYLLNFLFTILDVKKNDCDKLCSTLLDKDNKPEITFNTPKD